MARPRRRSPSPSPTAPAAAGRNHPRTRRLKAPDRRLQILNAAVRSFARFGYRGASTAALARAARVSQPVLYQHFDSKQGLFLALLDMAAEEAMRMFRTVIDPIESPLEQLRALMRLNPALTDPRLQELYTVVFHAQSERDPRIQTALREHYLRYANYLASIIERAQAAGQIRRDCSAMGMAWQLIHAAVGFAMLKPLEIPGHATRASIEQTMAMLMELISGGRGGAPAA